MWKDRTETERGMAEPKLKHWSGSIRVRMALMVLESSWLTELLIPILKLVLFAITPFLRAALEDFLIAQYKEALTTPNEADDLFYEFLLRILSIPIPE